MRGLALTYCDGHVLDRHTHPWAQLVYAASGVMRVSTPDAAWLVPPTRAIWAPGGTPHEIEMRGAVAMRTLYLAPTGDDPRLAACRAIEVSPLLRELILHIVRVGTLDAADPGHARIEGLLVDLLAQAETAPLELPLPRDPRARRMAERRRTSASSLRSSRLPLEAWRARARMQQAVAALAGGASVTATALDAGYQSPSAFIAAFKRTFGVTPARWRGQAQTR